MHILGGTSRGLLSLAYCCIALAIPNSECCHTVLTTNIHGKKMGRWLEGDTGSKAERVWYLCLFCSLRVPTMYLGMVRMEANPLP
jgi:hypothetical protein